MKLCSENCMPCCDFCIHAVHETWVEEGRQVIGGPIYCRLYRDQEHDDIVFDCSYCDDFECFMAD
jgi:hypothetical protein